MKNKNNFKAHTLHYFRSSSYDILDDNDLCDEDDDDDEEEEEESMRRKMYTYVFPLCSCMRVFLATSVATSVVFDQN